MKNITKFEIINHGVELPNYFQGCGTAFTEFDFVQTGAGFDLKEAFDDALEQLAQCDYEISQDLEAALEDLEDHGNCSGNDEAQYYISIRVK